VYDLLALRNQLVNGEKQCKDCCNPETPEDNCPILISDSFCRQSPIKSEKTTSLKEIQIKFGLKINLEYTAFSITGLFTSRV
jgi:hypothetical protein